jgi:hypothetical protein
MASATNLELLYDTDEDVVLVSSPLSMIAPMRYLLANEVRALRARGKRVVAIEPFGEASRAMGMNPLDLARSPAVAHATYRSMRQHLESHRELRALF